MLILEKYTIGVGDRFAHQAKAQLQACVQLAKDGIDVVPVWNKSNREHSFIGSEPQSVYDAAEAAVDELAFHKGWHVDADLINMDTVDKYLACSDLRSTSPTLSGSRPRGMRCLRSLSAIRS